jgi:hypothetical protein
MWSDLGGKAWRLPGLQIAFVALLLASLPAVTYAGTFVSFGPQTYVRATGTPSVANTTFTVTDPTTTFTMQIDSKGVSSAIVTLNGVQVFKESDFNANVTLLTKAVTLKATNQLSVEMRGKPGESFKIQIIGVDNGLPTISAAVSPGPNAAGWNKTDPTVTFTCADSNSGVVFCSQPIVISSETAGQIVVGTAVDKAGNVATTSVTVKLDKTPPSLAFASPLPGGTVFVSPTTVNGTATDVLSGLATVSCNGVPALPNAGSFTCGVPLTPGANSINAIAVDVAGNAGNATLNLTYARIPVIKLTSPTHLSYLNLSPTTITGTVDDPTATVTINSIQAAVNNGQFSLQLPLAEGPNIITATATAATGAVGNTSIEVTLDTTPPRVNINSPADKFVTTEDSITVSGSVNDIVVGTVNDEQAKVSVNGTPAQVANRLFLATSIPLQMGDNVIQAVGRDRVGNAGTTQITVTREAPPPSRIRVISGNNQTGPIGSVLPASLVVAVTDSQGNPFANKSVIFKVIQDDGMVNAAGPFAPTVIANTDGQGRAQAQWKLGMRAGAGGNSVEAYVVGVNGTAIFTATATQGQAGKIVVDTGNDQIGEVKQPLPKPFIAVVVDNGNNRLAGVPVTFTVKEGAGDFGGQTNTTVVSDSDGRVAATLTLGNQEGNANNLVEATFPNNQSFPVGFRASGRAPGDPSKTTISGVVLDNSNVPIPGVTIRAVLTNLLNSNSSIIQSAASVQTDAQGQFKISPAPVGFVDLFVDGSTAARPGKFPTLDYDMVTVAGQDNTVGLPIYLLPLNPKNELCVTATTGGGTLTIPEAPGFSLTFGPGQVTFPGGSKEGCVNVTVVHGDKVPMVPGFGQQPRFIVTIQPAGAVFNPPAAITLPNVDGLKPRAVTEMYSFDHDIGSFVAIGTGVVSDDGQFIRSSPGVGVLKAGWHCGGDPNTNGTVANCPTCQTCQGSSCVTDQAKENQPCETSPERACYRCNNGSCKQPDCNPSGQSQFFNFDFGPISSKLQTLQDRLNDGLKLAAKGKPLGASVNFSSLTGGRTQSFACCPDCTKPKPSDLGWVKSEYQLGAKASVTGSLGYCTNDSCRFLKVVPLIDVRVSFGVTGTPSIELTLEASGSGGGSVIEDCPTDTCGFVKGSVTLSGEAKAGAGAEAKAELFEPDQPGCPSGITAKAAEKIDACWGSGIGIEAEAFTKLSSSKLASVDGEVKFPLPFTKGCLSAGGSCTWTALNADVVFMWQIKGNIGPFSISFGEETTFELFEGFSGSCF